MDAGKKVLLDLFAGSLRFTVPVYQRRYSWGEAQCRQLWTDIVTAGRHPDRTHFTGSVVWMQDGGIRPDGRSLCLLIDGQQRLASVSLLLIALAEHARRHPDGLCFSADMIVDRGYLVDKYSDGDARYKLTLSGDDRAVLRNLTDRLVDPGRPVSGGADSNLERNLDLFRGWVGAIGDANVVWNGLQRLEVVSVTLDQGRDEPQLVFESMNSTGLDLETSDLVRNYMLMGCPVDEQAALYGDYWQPMERRLRGLSFDAFLHDWMVATLARPVPRGRAMYSEFKRHAADSLLPRMDRVRGLLSSMLEYSESYAAVRGAEGVGDAMVGHRLGSLRDLDATVADPLVLRMLAMWRHGRVDRDGLLRMLGDLESYLFRRMVCQVSSNGLNKLVPSLIGRLDGDASDNDIADDADGADPAESFAAMLLTETARSTRMPADDEFRQALLGEDLYRPASRCKHLLAGLENRNHPKDPRDFRDYTIEHIMPQNAMAHAEWRGMLEDPDRFPLLVNGLGNLTLTAYNSELSDGSFTEKRNRMVGGYGNEYLSISREPREADRWDETAIRRRGERLATLALDVWPMPEAGGQALLEQRGHGQTGEHGNSAVDFAALCGRGILKSGDVLESGYAGVDATATVTGDGRIRLANGETFTSPSGAFRRARELAAGEDMQVNGWVAWRLPDGRPLDSLRRNDGTASVRHAFWKGLCAYAATRSDFIEAYGDPSRRKPKETTWTSFGIGSSYCHLDGIVSVRDGYVAVDMYFTDTARYARLYGMRDRVAGMLKDLGTVDWNDPDTDRKNRLLKIRHNADFNADMTDAYQWMVDTLLAMRRIRDLLD